MADAVRDELAHEQPHVERDLAERPQGCDVVEPATSLGGRLARGGDVERSEEHCDAASIVVARHDESQVAPIPGA